MRVLLTITALAITLLSFGQTEFSGAIYSSTTWSKEKSPYIITGDVVINQGRTLIVEPGVEIRFNGSYYLEINGRLIARGNEKDSILFSSNMDKPQKMDWKGTRLTNTESAMASFEYCIFSYADVANEITCCWASNSINFKHCSFRSNNIVMMGYYGSKVLIDHCDFRRNTIGILDGEKSITHSFFTDNDFGLYNTSGADVSFSTFSGNRVAYQGMRAVIKDCIISGNETGVAPYWTNPDVIHCIISDNLTGIQIQGLYENEPGVVQQNKICNNEIYNVELLNNVNIDLTSNCWCETDSLKIAEYIYDGYDDISLGLASFGLQGIDCASFEIDDNDGNEYGRRDFKIYPNPVLLDLNIECQNCNSDNVKDSRVFIYNLLGVCVFQRSVSFRTYLTLDLSSLEPGMYIMNILYDDNLSRQVIVKI